MYSPFPFHQFQQPYNPMPMQPMQQSGIIGVTEVDGMQGAQAAQVPFGNTALLMDSQQPYFYVKQVDNQGIATIKQFKFEEYNPMQEQLDSNYVTRAEFDDLKEKYESLSQQSAAQQSSVQHAGPTELCPTNQPSASTATGTGNAEQWSN